MLVTCVKIVSVLLPIAPIPPIPTPNDAIPDNPIGGPFPLLLPLPERRCMMEWNVMWRREGGEKRGNRSDQTKCSDTPDSSSSALETKVSYHTRQSSHCMSCHVVSHSAKNSMTRHGILTGLAAV